MWMCGGGWEPLHTNVTIHGCANINFETTDTTTFKNQIGIWIMYSQKKLHTLRGCWLYKNKLMRAVKPLVDVFTNHKKKTGQRRRWQHRNIPLIQTRFREGLNMFTKENWKSGPRCVLLAGSDHRQTRASQEELPPPGHLLSAFLV